MTRFALLFSFALVACGDDDTPTPDAPVTTADAPVSTVDAAGPSIDAAGPGIDAETPTVDAAAGNVAPTIDMIAWTTTTPCGPGMITPFTVTMSVTDPDTSADNLTYSGSVPGCTGTFDTNPDTLNCPNAAPYTGTLMVTDDTGLSDSLSITISPCTNGSETP